MERKIFPIEDYPRIAKYVGDIITQRHMTYPYRLLSDEDMANVILGWIEYYEQKIEQTVENTFLLFEAAGQSLGGHEVMGERWQYPNRRGNSFTREVIRQSYDEKMRAAIAHLFQQFGEFKGKNSDKRTYDVNKTYHGGAAGLGIYVQWSLRFMDSELKRVKARCVTDFSFGVQAVCRKHSEQDIC